MVETRARCSGATTRARAWRRRSRRSAAGETMEALRGVIEHPRVAELQDDAGFWSRVDQGDLDGALGRPERARPRRGPRLRGQLAELGLVTSERPRAPDAFEGALADRAGRRLERLARLRDDPEMRALLADPEVLGLVERRDALGLLSHPRFRSAPAAREHLVSYASRREPARGVAPPTGRLERGGGDRSDAVRQPVLPSRRADRHDALASGTTGS